MTSPHPSGEQLLIRLDDVIKRYGQGDSAFTALNHVSVSINKGESVAIIGKSGAGKSTFMHLTALLDTPTSGSITLNGTNTTKLSASQLAKVRNDTFGFVFQQFFLITNGSVLDNVALPLTIAGVNRRRRERRAMNALKLLGLDNKAHNKASDLSGGQKQRVVIARALINEPDVIFADEPTGNLDSATGQVVEDTLFSLHRDRGITLVIVTHDPDLAAKCDRQITIADGRVASDERKAL
ncbi:ABC transporter ATP-binding protein [Bifidobacterium tsurumiense]|uniref:ABC transporter ATP-binding protein n=1 Tax=Bifidobacterium tsurumiense TaxID=356829 RepID=UPI0012B2469D|nr:ABC transporter ATP-binding protein [Bifidobacterium tsurumiense]MSS12397.1 ABC transporter ATP-binding protein [Bifidobacterium tsurumiense]